MAKRIDVNLTELMTMAESGVHQKEIMKKFGYKSVTQLKVALANASMETNKAIPALVGGRGGAAEKKVSRIVKVAGKGNLTLTKKLTEELKLAVGDKFEVKKNRTGGLTLTPVKD